MRFLALALFIVAAVSNCECRKSVQELIDMADESGAPFTPTALSKMNKTFRWDPEFRPKNVQTVVINNSKRSFRLQENKTSCFTGGFAEGLEPETVLAQGTSTVFAVEVTRFIHCTATYRSQDGFTSVEMGIQGNSYILALPLPKDFTTRTIQNVDAYADGAQVIFVISDRKQRSAPYLMLSQQGGLPVPHKKPKGSRNQFIKASKKGSRVRTI